MGVDGWLGRDRRSVSSCAATPSTTRTSGVILGDGEASRHRHARPRTCRRARSSPTCGDLTDAPGHGRRGHPRPLRPRLRQSRLPACRHLGPRAVRHVHGADGRAPHGRDRAREEPTLAADLRRGRHRSARPDVRRDRHDRGRRAGGRASLPRPRPHRSRHRHQRPGDRRAVRRRPRSRAGHVPFFGDGYPLDWPATATALAELVATASSCPATATMPAGRSPSRRPPRSQPWPTLARRRPRRRADPRRRGRRRDRLPGEPRRALRGPLERALQQLRGELT